MAPTGEVGLPVATTLISTHFFSSVLVVPAVVEVDVVEVLVEGDALVDIDVEVLVVDVLVVEVVVVDAVVVVSVTVVVNSVKVVRVLLW